MYSKFPRGSEWIKWDLHVHVPGTTLSNAYVAESGVSDIDQFCRVLEESDVAVFGITDYFCLAKFFEFKRRYQLLYPNSTKMFLPNLELRLNEAVNRTGEEVNMHLIFSEALAEETARRFMQHLKTQITRPHHVACADLLPAEYARATVTRENIIRAIEETFGRGEDRQDNLLIFTSCKGDGIRPQRGALRKRTLTDEIDKMSDAFFGNSGSREYFLESDRLDEGGYIRPKPVVSGSDSHSFDDLKERLGRSVDREGLCTEITWIKANPHYEGLRQILVEPAERVHIGPIPPDSKEPYKVIDTIEFHDTNDFPARLELNGNLVALVGSRSSGKSALLAHIAHAIDPEYTVAQQVAAGVAARAEVAGPGAGRTWQEESTSCRVKWRNGDAAGGRVIYVPQNSLFAISGRPDEITAKIRPVVRRVAPEFFVRLVAESEDINRLNQRLRVRIADWFELHLRVKERTAQLRSAGSVAAVEGRVAELELEMQQLQEQSRLDDDEVSDYRLLTISLQSIEQRNVLARNQLQALSPYLTGGGEGEERVANIVVRVTLEPELQGLPAALAQPVGAVMTAATTALSGEVSAAVNEFHASLLAEIEAVKQEASDIEVRYSQVLEKARNDELLVEVSETLRSQLQVLGKVRILEEEIQALRETLATVEADVTRDVHGRLQRQKALVQEFQLLDCNYDGMRFGIQGEFNDDLVQAVSSDFNRRSSGPFIAGSDQGFDLQTALDEPIRFMDALRSGEQKIRQGREALEVATRVLTLTLDLRFFAELEGDRIGGFQRSSMTPGKQALFALTLILGEAEDHWPLLLDQPEDDLDSRSIYQNIVPYLLRRKRDRQILMATHDANLVVGADAEQIIIANRHGVDRPNENALTFDYLSGGLEDTDVAGPDGFALSECGVRQHVCDILDGGDSAFQKRKEKYNI